MTMAMPLAAAMTFLLCVAAYTGSAEISTITLSKSESNAFHSLETSHTTIVPTAAVSPDTSNVKTTASAIPLTSVAEEAALPLPTQTLLLLTESSWVEVVEAQPPEPVAQLATPFDEVGTADSTLEEKIILLERWLCGSFCGSFPNTWNPSIPEMCKPCYCDTKCVFFQDCCPDLLLSHNITYDHPKESAHDNNTLLGSSVGTECVPRIALPLKPTEIANDLHQVMFTRCTADIEDGSLSDRSKCETPDILVQDQYLPVSSLNTSLTYRNVYCALCHNDGNHLVSWTGEVGCSGSAELLIKNTHSKDELYHKLSTNESVQTTQCQLTYNPPNPMNDYSRSCAVSSQPVVRLCNSSGNVKWYDANIWQACELYESVFMADYRNIFCFLCNQDYVWHITQLDSFISGSDASHTARVSFAAMFDFRDEAISSHTEEWEQLATEKDCGPKKFIDVTTGLCKDLGCSEGKYLDTEGICQSLLTTNLLGYYTCFRFDITSLESLNLNDLETFLWAVNSISQDGSVRDHSSDIIEYCPGDNNVSFYFTSHVWYDYSQTLETYEELIGSYYERYKREAEYQFGDSPSRNYSLSTLYPCMGKMLPENQCRTNSSIFLTGRTMTGPIAQGSEKVDVYYINYTQTTGCAFASLSQESFSYETDWTREDEFLFKSTGTRIPASRVTLIDGEVRVCKSDYQELIANATIKHSNKTDHTDYYTWTVSGLVSIVSTCVSLLCLALTFLTYAILPQMRSKGGKNIMALTVFLFLAQALYEFGIEQFENTYLCIAIGIAVHFSWQVAVFSSNACTIERFLKLRYPLATRAFFLSDRRPFLIATGYSLLCPLIIVLANGGANLALRGDIGYGGNNLCFINNRYARIFAFALPIGIVVVVNVFLLAVTVWSLRRTRKNFGNNPQARQETPESISMVNTEQAGNRTNVKRARVGLLACVRLSVVTGLTWLLAFLYELAPYEGLGYVITALIGLQGVTFFLSLVINRHVMVQLKEVSSSALSSHSSASTNTSSKNRSGRNTDLRINQKS